MDHLWKFRTLDMPKLLLNTDWLIMPLLVSFHRFLSLFHNRSSIFSLFYAKRLLCMKKGCWKFRITRELNEREITAALGRDLKVLYFPCKSVRKKTQNNKKSHRKLHYYLTNENESEFKGGGA